MSQERSTAHRQELQRSWRGWLAVLCAAGSMFASRAVGAQDDVAGKVRALTEAMSRVEAQLQESQRQLDEMRRQLSELQGGKTTEANRAAADGSQEAGEDAAKLAAQVEELRERQAMQETQIAVHDQAKVESASKYPVKLSGLVLMSGFVNTRGVDMPATPTLAVAGAGSTGATARQTILGVDLRGPHVFGAESHGDVRVDFDGSTPVGTGYGGGYGVDLLRLRTAHASLDWEHTEAFFALDRPITSANWPDSLTAVAEPPLAWSGNLWSWNPQFGVTQDLGWGGVSRLRAQAAVVDVGDAPYTSSLVVLGGATQIESTAEASRWPGAEARIAMLGGSAENGVQVGVGGLYAPHRSIGGTRFDSWAGTMDVKLPLPAHMALSGAFYRGQALGGLGGGAYKDYVYRVYEGRPYFRALDDVGGWGQWKQKVSERLEFNEAVGIDNVPAGELEPYAGTTTSVFQNITRNRTAMGNVIYSPSAYLLFSLEYRRISSSAVNLGTTESDVIGVGAGYKF
ncbi:MAG TPA: hypothetical protein VIY99_16095 [Terracidiphilus sp.]